MTISEVFPHPTVETVIFQIRYPNLFSIGDKIGDFQLKIIKEFPKSSLLFQQPLMFTRINKDSNIDIVGDDINQSKGNQIWQFKSENDEYTLNITSNSLDITSNLHKTYDNPASENKFRDIIEFVISSFFSIINLPIIKRLGLRYIDNCPIKEVTVSSFTEYYNSAFPLSRFDIGNSKSMEFKTEIKKGDYFLIYKEIFANTDGIAKYIIDFDGYTKDIDSSQIMEITDNLHKIISDEYEDTIKEPVYKYMRSGNLDG